LLSEILDAAAPRKREARANRAPGISMSSLFPCAYRLRLVHDSKYWAEELTPQQYYTMEDGWWQEEQSVRRLAKAGITIENRQREVTVGKSKVPGSYDGDFILNGIRYLWEHKAYADDGQAVWFMTMWGLDKLPSQKAQTNGYMLGGGLEWCDFFVKLKSSNTYPELVYQIDRPFIEEIVEWCDKIRLEDWKPKPKKCKWCSHCNVGCFDEGIDFSWIATADESEMVQKWLEGDKYEKVGKMLKEEADAALIGVRDKQGKFIRQGLIGDKDLLVLPGMEIKKIIQHRFSIDKNKVLQELGPEGLIRVGYESDVVQYRHKET